MCMLSITPPPLSTLISFANILAKWCAVALLIQTLLSLSYFLA